MGDRLWRHLFILLPENREWDWPVSLTFERVRFLSKTMFIQKYGNQVERHVSMVHPEYKPEAGGKPKTLTRRCRVKTTAYREEHKLFGCHGCKEISGGR
jgi:hypothetical protein